MRWDVDAFFSCSGAKAALKQPQLWMKQCFSVGVRWPLETSLPSGFRQVGVPVVVAVRTDWHITQYAALFLWDHLRKEQGPDYGGLWDQGTTGKVNSCFL